jgi:toxin ParE1/3/4
MKTYAVVFTPRATRQLAELYRYIADDNGEVLADGFVSRIVDSCTALSTFPEIGRKRDDVRPNLRTKAFGRRVMIAFLVNQLTDTVAIHGVFYGGQNFEQMLRESKDDE